MLNKIGDEANKRGIKFGYHNHNLEFAKIAGTDQMYEDFLISNTDPDKVIFEMDVYWTTVGGQDPVAYLKKYPNRIKVLHIKDDYVLGESGKIDYKAIFKQFYKNGNEDWFVEMEGKMTPEQREKYGFDGEDERNSGQGWYDAGIIAEMSKNRPKDDKGQQGGSRIRSAGSKGEWQNNLKLRLKGSSKVQII